MVLQTRIRHQGGDPIHTPVHMVLGLHKLILNDVTSRFVLFSQNLQDLLVMFVEVVDEIVESLLLICQNLYDLPTLFV